MDFWYIVGSIEKCAPTLGRGLLFLVQTRPGLLFSLALAGARFSASHFVAPGILPAVLVAAVLHRHLCSGMWFTMSLEGSALFL